MLTLANCYILRARNILRETRAAESEIYGSNAKQCGRVKIILPCSLANAGLADVIVQFGLDHPNIGLEVIYANGIRDLHSERIDISIHLSHKAIDSATLLFSSQVDWIVCATQEYLKQNPTIQTPADLSNHTVICYAVKERRVPFWARRNDEVDCLMLQPHISTND